MKARVICMLMLAVLTLGVGACDQGEHPTYYLGQNFKDYILFPEGSYWIYDQESTSRKDSVFLYYQELEINQGRRAYSFNFEQVFQSMSSSYYKDTLNGSGGITTDGNLVFCLYTEGYLSNSQERNLQFFTKHEVGSTLEWTENMQATYIDSLSALVVNSIEYKDVKVFESAVLRGPLMTKRIYYARGVGVIRKELFNGQVWNLLRYKVNY